MIQPSKHPLFLKSSNRLVHYPMKFISILFFCVSFSFLTSTYAQSQFTPTDLKARILQREDSLRSLISVYRGSSMKRGRKSRVLGFRVVNGAFVKVYREKVKIFKSGQSLSRRTYFPLTMNGTVPVLGANPILRIRAMNGKILYADYTMPNQTLQLFNENTVTTNLSF